MYRVFDALQFDSEENNKWETGLSSTGEFSEEQSLELGILVRLFDVYMKIDI